ncbi:hypothetical protein EON65_31665 [archaeon]|nr:MAG: hypothetical protein EON65_31665 [archaeon]
MYIHIQRSFSCRWDGPKDENTINSSSLLDISQNRDDDPAAAASTSILEACRERMSRLKTKPAAKVDIRSVVSGVSCMHT